MPLPIPDLDTKNFDEYFEEARAALPALAPEWTDYNLSDPGITLLELFSWLSDIDTYRLNRVDQRHILKYLKLLDAMPESVKPAKTWITFQSDSLGSVSQGTELLAKDIERNVSMPFVTQHEVFLQTATLIKIDLKNERGLISYEKPFPRFFYPFGQVTKKSHYFELAFDGTFSSDFSLTFILFEDDLPTIGKHGKETPVVFPSAELLWEYYDGSNWRKDFKIEEDGTNSFSKSGTIYFKETADASKIRCKLDNYHFENAPRIQAVLTNTTEVIQIKDKDNEKESEKGGTGLPKQTLQLKAFPLLSLDVEIESEGWQEVESLEMFGHDQKVYQVDNTSGTITFGDGVHGKIPPLDVTIFCKYTTSAGAQGNISQNLEWSGSTVNAQNYFPAIGGKDPQTIEEAYVAFKKDFRTPYQAVTAGDFEYLAINTPGLRIARAKALPYKEENRVEVIVVPFSFQKLIYPSEGFLKTVCYHLDKHRLITTTVEAIPPEYALISVKSDLKIKADYTEQDVKDKVETVLNLFLDPLGGWKDQQGWPFGHSVYESDIYALLEEVEGVDCVLDVVLSAEGAYEKYEHGNIILKTDALTSPYRHRISVFTSQEVCRSTI